MPRLTTEHAYQGPVRPSKPNPAAAGNITRLEVCGCGARRLVNVNQRHREASVWL
jgi:hypothetical protein